MRITICGSIAFYQGMLAVKALLDDMGHEVKLPPAQIENNFGVMIPVEEYYRLRKEEPDKNSWVWDAKALAMRRHFEKVAWSEAVLVLNYDKNGVAGYVGANTLMEMGVAFYLEKPIYLLKPIPDMAYREEIIGVKPIVLDEKLEFFR